jgi:transposase
VNPFACPDSVYVATRPQDMRAGINRLSAIVAAELGEDPMAGDLYVFVSRDCRRVKMIRFETNAWCMWTVAAVRGGFRWRAREGAGPVLEVERRQLMFLLEGLEMRPADAPRPVAAHTLL